MASNQGSNNLEDFDIEQVINWEEHNYASKNLEFQHLPDLDLQTDLPTSASALPTGHGTQPQVSHGRTMLLGNQVIGSQQQPQREQNTNIARPLSQTSNSVLNPVFPQDASYMLNDIRQEFAHTRNVPNNPRDVQPAFPSENFDLPSIQHARQRRSSGSQVLNFMPGRDQHLVASASQLGRTMTRHASLHNGMQTFSQTGLHSNITNVEQPMNHGLDSVEGGDNSIDQLIEDIVDRDMPQGVGDTIEFSGHDVALVNQHQQIHHVMSQSTPHVTTSLTSSSQNQMITMARNASSIHTSTGSPLPGSGQVAGANIAHAHSPLSQNPASPASTQVQYKPSQIRGNRGSIKSSVTMTAQQQPHSPQNLGMGVAHSPRSAPQRSPQNPPQRSPQTQSAQSPPSAVNPGMSQNIPSPMSSGAMNINSPVIGNMGMQHSPVASPMNIPSPQSQRSSRQASPGGCNIGSPANPAVQQSFPKSPGKPQSYMAQMNQPKVQNTGTGRTQINMQNTGNTSMHPANAASGQNNAWVQNQFMTNQQRQTSNTSQGGTPSPGQQRQTNNASQGSGSVPSPGQQRQTAQGNIPLPGQQLQRQTTAGNISSSGQQQRQTNTLPQGNVSLPGQLQRQTIQGNVLLPGQQQQQAIQANISSPGQPQGNIPSQLQRQSPQGNVSIAGQLQQPLQGNASLRTQQQRMAMQANMSTAGQQRQTSNPSGNVAQQSVNLQTNTSVAQQTNPSIAGKPVSAFDTAAVLRGLTALKGSIPFQIKQGTNQQLQAIKIPPNAANADLLKQAAQATGKPMTINTSQGQVLCYILPKSAVNNQAGASTTQGQQLRMVVLSTNASSGINAVKTVNSSGDGTTVVASNINSTGINPVMATRAKPSQQNVLISSTNQNPMHAMTTVVNSVGNDIPNNTQKVTYQKQAPVNVQVGQRLVSNPSTAQSVDTTRITFVNESTSVDHFVSIPMDTTAATTAAVETKTTPTLLGDSDDSDTPLAILAENLRKANGEEKKKKKKKKGEKRKKKEKSGIEKPLPAFQIFFKETQAAIRQQNPSIDFDNVTKIVNQMWENLPEDQKKVYQAKQDKAKKDYDKALEKQKQEPSPKIRKVGSTTATPLSSTPLVTPPTTPTKEPVKQESITLKIPKAILNKQDIPTKTPKTTSSSKTAASTTFAPARTKKSKLAINPISQRICIREGCNMPARTTKERGTQYCSNECIVSHCRNVFQGWVTKRKDETVQVS